MKKSTPSPPPTNLLKDLTLDLQTALESWDKLSKDVDGKLSPEEEQLKEIQRILSELKSKLNEFEA